MSVNPALSERFQAIADMLELLGEDKFRILAHQRAARTIDGLAQDLSAIAHDRAALTAIEGVGPKIADKIAEFCSTGRIAEHEELKARVPAGLLDLMRIPGVGPKTVRMFWTEKGVTDRAGLKRIIADGSILGLPRMGEKAVAKIKDALAFAEQAPDRMPLGIAMPIAESIAGAMSRAPGVVKAAFAGSLRRGRDTIGDIDILAATDDPAAAHAAFTGMPGVQQVLATGATKSSVRVRAAGEGGRWSGAGEGPTTQVDLRTVPPRHWGAALMYFTGSKEHNVRLRERALKKGWTLNEYGLYPDDDDPTPPQHRGLTPLAGETEEEVFRALGLPWIPPEIREDRGELDLDATPRLIEARDVVAELHAHTTESDGSLALDDLVAEAARRGFHTIAVTDHSRSSVQAHGLTVERLRAQAAAVAAARARHPAIEILHGSEVDILADGSLDYPDDVLAELAVVVASPHAALTQDPAAATKRLLRAVRHPAVRVLGHPTGRLINRRPGLSPDLPAVFAAAAEAGVAVEINAHWQRLDLRDTHARAALEAGCLIAINCDVHSRSDFDNLRYGVVTGRRAWLTPDRCVNTWSRDRLLAWLKDRSVEARAGTAGSPPSEPAGPRAAAPTATGDKPRSGRSNPRARRNPTGP